METQWFAFMMQKLAICNKKSNYPMLPTLQNDLKDEKQKNIIVYMTGQGMWPAAAAIDNLSCRKGSKKRTYFEFLPKVLSQKPLAGAITLF